MVVFKCRRAFDHHSSFFFPGGIPLPRRGTCPDIRMRVKGYGRGKPYKPHHTPKGVYGLQGRALVRFKPGAGRQTRWVSVIMTDAEFAVFVRVKIKPANWGIGEPIGGSHKKAEAGAVARRYERIRPYTRACNHVRAYTRLRKNKEKCPLLSPLFLLPLNPLSITPLLSPQKERKNTPPLCMRARGARITNFK